MANAVDPQLKALLERQKTYTDKIARLKNEEISAEQSLGDGRHEEAIARNEEFLRQVNTAIAEKQKKAAPAGK